MANYVLNEELRRAVVQVINQHQSSFQPRPKRGRRVRNGGGSVDSKAAVLGSVAVASTSIPAATETTWGSLPATTTDKLKSAYGGVAPPGSTKVWILGKGSVTKYILVAEMGGQFNQNILNVYAIPESPSGTVDTAVYSTVRNPIAANKLLQGKTIGTDATGFFVIDVEPC